MGTVGMHGADPATPTARWQLDVGPATSMEDSTLRMVSADFNSLRVAARFRSVGQPFDGLPCVHVQIFRRGEPGQITVAAVSVHNLDPATHELCSAWTLDGAGRYELRILDAASRQVLASSLFHIR